CGFGRLGSAAIAHLRVRNKDMGWATPYIDKLRKGETVQFRPRGDSMSGEIESGQLCTVVPVNSNDLEVGDIVLCKVNGYQYIHLIKARQGDRFQIGNNRGRINALDRSEWYLRQVCPSRMKTPNVLEATAGFPVNSMRLITSG